MESTDQHTETDLNLGQQFTTLVHLYVAVLILHV